MTTVALSVTTVNPLGDRVFLKVTTPRGRTDGGILLPEAAQEKPQVGEVVAVGPGHLNESGEHQPIEVEVGNHVLYSKYSGIDIKLKHEDYVLISERDLLATLA